MNPLPVLACQFFKINYLHTSKNTLFQDSSSNIVIKSDIIIIGMNTATKIRYLFKIYKNLEKLTHFRPVLRTETYQFECITQRNSIKTSYYDQRMTEHYVPLKIPINSNTTTNFSPKKQPRGTDGPVPAK